MSERREVPAIEAANAIVLARRRFCDHVYCRHFAARELESSGQPLEADRIYSQKRLVRCRL